MKIKKLEAELLYNKDIHLTIIASDGDFNAIHRLSQLSEEENRNTICASKRSGKRGH